VSRVLVYCAFQHGPELSLPSAGVQAAPVQVKSIDKLRLLWSEIEWPLAPEHLQQSAVEFHGVVHHVFRQAAVIPFRLLSVFDDEAVMAAFAEENQTGFIEDLERLQDFVQMECVVYPAPQPRAATTCGNSSGREYMEQKAMALRSSEGFAQAIRNALADVTQEIRVREAKNGTRIFVLVKRGQEKDFRDAVSASAVPERLSRRVSGPWPAAEFLSDRVKAPQISPAAGVK
jgi:Gas vesicle synthesis protein GvpL/GvpF